MYPIHEEIIHKINYFIKENKIPNIIFHGEHGNGKQYILQYLLHQIYSTKDELYNNTMTINCALDKGINYIRNEIKFFSKTNIHKCNKFKSIIMLYADKLTIDAQSALRRCVELFSNSTRFFLVVRRQQKLMSPILSRFANIHVPVPKINNAFINLNVFNQFQYDIKQEKTRKYKIIESCLKKTCKTNLTMTDAIQLYEKGISGLDVIQYFTYKYNHNSDFIHFKLFCEDIRMRIRNETMIIYFILYYHINSLNKDENFMQLQYGRLIAV